MLPLFGFWLEIAIPFFLSAELLLTSRLNLFSSLISAPLDAGEWGLEHQNCEDFAFFGSLEALLFLLVMWPPSLSILMGVIYGMLQVQTLFPGKILKHLVKLKLHPGQDSLPGKAKSTPFPDFSGLNFTSQVLLGFLLKEGSLCHDYGISGGLGYWMWHPEHLEKSPNPLVTMEKGVGTQFPAALPDWSFPGAWICLLPVQPSEGKNPSVFTTNAINSPD